MPRLCIHSILAIAFFALPWWMFLFLLILCAYAVPYAFEIILWGVVWDLVFSVPFEGPLGMSIWGTLVALAALLISRFLADEARLFAP